MPGLDAALNCPSRRESIDPAITGNANRAIPDATIAGAPVAPAGVH
jgi:hypothetical protein